MRRRGKSDWIGGERPSVSVYARLAPSLKQRLQDIADQRRESLNCMVVEILERFAAQVQVEAAAGGGVPGGPGREEGLQPPAAAVFDFGEAKESSVKVQLESTDKVVVLNGVPARIWEGHTACGVPCHAYITRIAVAQELDASEFERELQEHRPPSEEIRAIPSRLVL